MTKNPIADLCDRLHVLRMRYGVVFRELTIANPPYIPLAESLTIGLAARDRDAVIIVKTLVDPGDLERAEFWGTPLGRLLFAAGGSSETVSKSVAASVLGCSRQWIHALIGKGQLDSTGQEVYADQVRKLLAPKLDTLVK